jgi:hypothetical protein
MVDSVGKNVSKYIIFLFRFAGQGFLSTDPAVWVEGARPPPRCITKYLEIKIAESYINDL